MKTVQLVRKDLVKVPMMRYMTNDEIPEHARLKILSEALSITNECYDFRVALTKERVLEAHEKANNQSAWSIPLEGTISFYSIYSNRNLEEKIAALGFLMKGQEAKCMK